MLKSQKLRNAEYHEMTDIFDSLYKDSKNGKVFLNLIDIIGSKDNIILAYRNIKKNDGSRTPGIDHQTIEDLGDLSIDKIIKIIHSKLNDYKPKAVKRIEIPKSNGKTRPLGIPCIIDRLFQQCIKQVLEPICEAKFYKHSYGFRPNRSVEHAIGRMYFLIQKNKLHYCVDVDIKGFFDNIDHEELIRQIWNLKIRDKKLLSIIKVMLKAQIVLPNKDRIIPEKGTPQGGILSPLLANIVLNDLDWWITSQWEELPTKKNYRRIRTDKNKVYVDDSNRVAELKRTTKLKELHIVRYADDFKILCRNYKNAKSIYEATKEWLKVRLKLDISEEKSGITNLTKSRTQFLGFEIKLKEKSNKYVVQSNLSKKTLERIKNELVDVVGNIRVSKNQKNIFEKINQYNATVLGIHNFYCIATDISLDMQRLGLIMERVIYNRLRSFKIERNGDLNPKGIIYKNYRKSSQLRFLNNKPLIPIAYIKTKPPVNKNQEETPYTKYGRTLIHKNLGIDLKILRTLMKSEMYDNSVEYYDNRISLYCAQLGKCGITGEKLDVDTIHCHHKVPKSKGGSDKYDNLILVHVDIHRLIHATEKETINKYIHLIKDDKQLRKLNNLRRLSGLEDIEITL